MDHIKALRIAEELSRAGYNIPKPVTEGWLKEAASKGMILKKDLIGGADYLGSCRNALVAKWDADNGCFWYIREKFGKFFIEKINHPEDDNGFDLFIPTLRIFHPMYQPRGK